MNDRAQTEPFIELLFILGLFTMGTLTFGILDASIDMPYNQITIVIGYLLSAMLMLPGVINLNRELLS